MCLQTLHVGMAPCSFYSFQKSHKINNFAIVHDYLCSFQVSFGIMILLRQNKIQVTKDAMQQCEEITAIVRKVWCSSLAGSFIVHASHRGVESNSTVISGQGQQPYSEARAQSKSMPVYTVHTTQEHNFLGSRLVASCSITKNNVRGMYSGKQVGEPEKVTESYVTANRSSALLKLKSFYKPLRGR